MTARWLAAALACGCAVPSRSASLPPRDEAFVTVLSGEMPDPIGVVSRHAWIVVSDPTRRGLRRYEYLGAAESGTTSEPLSYFGDGDVAVHGVVPMDGARLAETIACFEAQTRAYGDEHPTYFPIPGPNSNTFVDGLLRRCGVHVELPATAIGRDYRGPIGASVTEAGTGVQVETWIVGAKIGLEEGVEAHLFDLPLGVHFWPPGITVPVNPGRIGFTFDTHRPGVEIDDDEPSRKREDGTGVAWMRASWARVVDPARAGGLTDAATVGLSGRAVLQIGDGPLGYGVGADVDLGAGFPSSLAHAETLWPGGLAVLIGPTGYLGVFAGVGASGVTTHVATALELPVEARLELEPGAAARVGLRGAVVWPVGEPTRARRELRLGTFVRVGRTRRHWGAVFGQGLVLGLERRELLDTAWLALVVGTESAASR